LIDLVGPLGVGTEVVSVGTGEGRKILKMTLIEQDFALEWQDIEANRKQGLPPEWGAAARAAFTCAHQEDELVFGGLLKAAGQSVVLGDWAEPGSAFASIVEATKALTSGNCFGPYAVVLSPTLYAKTQRVVKGMGRLESKLIKDIAEGGIFRSPVLEENQGLVLSLGSFNFDLAVGQDLITAYLGNEGLDHSFRVLESLALRIKRPDAICALTK